MAQEKPGKLKKMALAALALGIAAAIWLPCLHLFYAAEARNFRTEGISPAARALASRHLQLWTDPDSRRRELDKMRRSNAEWDFMGRSFLVWSLANMALRDPACAPENLKVMDGIIDETLRLERQEGIYIFLMPYAKLRPYQVQPARSIFIDSEIAMMLAARRLVQEKPEYQAPLRERIGLMVSRMEQSPLLSSESYPDEYWIFDNVAALAAMRMADRLDGTDHSGFCRRWIELAKTKFIDKQTGLLIPRFNSKCLALDPPRSSSMWFVVHCLQVVDPAFARDQYERTRREFSRIVCGFGYSTEYPAAAQGRPDIDSGVVIPGLQVSAGGSGLAFIGAASFGDDTYLQALDRTLNFAAFPSRRQGSLKYRASNQVGDAVLLYAAVLGPLWQKVSQPVMTALPKEKTP